MLADDRDLVVYEPNVFRDAGVLNQRLFTGIATITGTTLMCGEADFAALGVGPGSVVECEGLTLEVLARPTAVSLTVSRVRARPSDAAVPPGDAVVGFSVVTCRPQVGAAHERVVRGLGLVAEGFGPAELEPSGRPRLGESSITNPSALRRLVALGALEQVFLAVASLRGGDDPAQRRSEEYRRQWERERGAAVAWIDTDGDGVPNEARRVAPASGELARA